MYWKLNKPFNQAITIRAQRALLSICNAGKIPVWQWDADPDPALVVRDEAGEVGPERELAQQEMDRCT